VISSCEKEDEIQLLNNEFIIQLDIEQAIDLPWPLIENTPELEEFQENKIEQHSRAWDACKVFENLSVMSSNS
jgi:hypothetical protein